MSAKTGAINPWSTESERFDSEALCWDDPDYKTPFAVLAEFIQSWPGETPTSELDDAKRHARLIETIAGYPEIATGRRPMDMPLHPKAILAFKLTDFIDKIPGPSGFEWHSLKTALLHYDLRHHDNMNHTRFFHHFMKKIREHTTLAGGTMYGNELHPDEIRFITVLHSQANSRLKFWPVNEQGGLIWETFEINDQPNIHDPFMNPTRVNVKTDKEQYHEHEFRFKSIQGWVTEWYTDTPDKHWLNPNASQNLLTGASVMLESILAKMRSYILTERRAGSIIIDGGGRLRYLSTNTIEEEANWFKNKVNNALLLDPAHPHPFAATIKHSLDKYISTPVVFETLENRFSSEKEKDDFSKFYGDPRNGGERKLTQEGFRNLIGSKVAAHFLPEIRFRPTKDDEHQPLQIRSWESTWEFKNCVLCNRSPPSKNMQNNGSIQAILKAKGHNSYVCQFHTLLFEIGRTAKTRLSSYPDLFTKTPLQTSEGEKGITHMVKLDGNGIGQIFNRPVTIWEPPRIEEVPHELWEELVKNDIMNLKEKWDGLNFRSLMGKLGLHGAEKSVLIRRMQPLLRTQRRSISFNINWWLSLHEAFNSTRNVSMLPWVMAGDDIVLVNHQGLNLKGLKKFFSKFQENLCTRYPDDLPVTFAGAIIERGEFNIAQMYNEVSKREKLAAKLWKWRANLIASKDAPDKSSTASQLQEWDILGEKKRIKLEEWLKDHDEADLKRLYDEHNEEGFVFTTEGGYPSLLLLRPLSESA